MVPETDIRELLLTELEDLAGGVRDVLDSVDTILLHLGTLDGSAFPAVGIASALEPLEAIIAHTETLVSNVRLGIQR